jgi:hypothetical protein
MDMNTAAIIATGAIVVGLILYIPGHLLAKYVLRRSSPKGSARSRITRLGVAVYVPMVLALFIGFAQGHLSVHTWFGQFMSHWGGRLTYAGLLVVVWACIEYVLSKRGHVLWERASIAQQAVAADPPKTGAG